MKLPPPSALLLAATLAIAALPAAPVTERTIASPDGSLVFTLERDPATDVLSHSLRRGGRPVVTRGALGIEIAGTGVVAGQGKVAGTASREIDATWQNPFGEQATVRDRCREETITLRHPSHGALGVKLQVRAYDEGVAWRYLVSGRGQLTVTADRTSFPLPADTRVWTSTSAQGPIGRQNLAALAATVERPLLAELAGDLFAAIGEAALLDGARMRLARSGNSTLVASLAGSTSFDDSFTSPWRFVRVASSPAALLQGNHFMLNLNEPSRIADPSWIRPGKVLREVTLTTQGGLACIDFAAANGLQYIMFDAGWYGPERSPQADATKVNLDPARSRGPLDLPAVIAHGKRKGIGVILYVNQIALSRQLGQIAPLYQSWGVAGIKFGFVNVGPQAATRWLHEAVATCARHRLMVDIHDEYRPTGVSRTWPNLLTQEGVRGDEESPDNGMVLNTLFTRCLAGAADQTNCYFAPRIAQMGSHASQLAKSVLVFSPWQFLFWYDRPEGSPGGSGAGNSAGVLREVPELSFFRRLPTAWDQTLVLDGYPGSHATIARRKGNSWFVAGLTGQAARELRVPLGFLPAGKGYRAEVFVDDPAVATPTKVRVDTRRVTAADTLTLPLDASRGFAAILAAETP